MNIFKKGIIAAMLCASSAMVLLSCSNSGSGDDSPATDTYSGSFTVNGTNYSSLSVTNGTYTMTGSGNNDSGTYATYAAVLADGTYLFTSTGHGGTFTVTINGNTITLSKGSGTLTASGTGTLYAPVSGGSSSNGAIPVETKWITVQPGTFRRGTQYTMHDVTLTKPFIMCDHEVTQGEWKAVMGRLPNSISQSERVDSYPVSYVSWNEAAKYCNALSQKEGLSQVYTINGDSDNTVTWINKNANGYRLPTTAEWEWAARAGNTSTDTDVWSGTTSESTLGEYAWYSENSTVTYIIDGEEAGREHKIHNVKTKKPNALGLYDMSGNVYEYCWDYVTVMPSSEAETDPYGAEYGMYREGRGGSYGSDASGCKVTGGIINQGATSGSGFRVVRNAQ